MFSGTGGVCMTRWGRWIDWWLGWRDRALASPVFQRRAASFALTRPVARRQAGDLFDLVAGFVYSQVLFACVQLRLFDILAEGPQTEEYLADRLAMPLEGARRLLNASVALRLVEPRGGGRYGLGTLGAPLVGNLAVAAMVQHHAALYADLADPLALLRASPEERQHNALARYWAYDEANGVTSGPAAERVATYSALMAASLPLVADEILDAYHFARHQCLLDVGGGTGQFLGAVGQRVPSLELRLFELPAVAERARSYLGASGLASRATVFSGSFLADPLPRGADIISLVRVVHDHDDAQAMALLRAVHAALPDGGTLLLAEPMAQTPGAEAMGDAYFGVYLYAMGRGRPRGLLELAHMLRTSGFEGVRPVKTRLPLQTQILIARRHRKNPV
jgi:demethylspheroidene O-methyltransferase